MYDCKIDNFIGIWMKNCPYLVIHDDVTVTDDGLTIGNKIIFFNDCMTNESVAIEVMSGETSNQYNPTNFNRTYIKNPENYEVVKINGEWVPGDIIFSCENEVLEQDDEGKIRSEISSCSVNFSVGIQNIGNTCFLASLIQAVFRNPIIYSRLRHTSYRILFEQLFSKNRSVVDVSLIRALKKSLSKIIPEFSGFDQQDPSEALGALINLFEKTEEFRNPFIMRYNPTFSCTRCNKETINPQESFEQHYVTFKRNTSFSRLVYESTLPTNVEKYCEYCGGQTLHIKYIEDIQTPEILAITLLRYYYENGRLRKYNDSVVPDRFIIFDGDLYSLCSIICHSGNSANSGHYTSFVRDMTTERMNWFYYDDSNVSYTGKENSCSGAMFFYNKIKI